MFEAFDMLLAANDTNLELQKRAFELIDKLSEIDIDNWSWIDPFDPRYATLNKGSEAAYQAMSSKGANIIFVHTSFLNDSVFGNAKHVAEHIVIIDDEQALYSYFEEFKWQKRLSQLFNKIHNHGKQKEARHKFEKACEQKRAQSTAERNKSEADKVKDFKSKF